MKRRIVLSDELLNWVEEVNNKTLKKDVFGHPIGEHINFQRWEQRRMIDFIIKSGNICNAGLMSTWECAENLKVIIIDVLHLIYFLIIQHRVLITFLFFQDLAKT